MTAKQIVQIFSCYQKARITFVQAVSELASKEQNVSLLLEARVIDFLKPLLQDVCPQIRQCAAVALGKLVDLDARVAKSVMDSHILDIILTDLDTQNKFYKKSAMYCLRSISKHDADLAKAVVDEGGLAAIIYCLGSFDQMVQESGICAISAIAKHNFELAQAVVDAGALPNIILCLQEPHISMKQVAAVAISDIAKHTSGLAMNVMDCGAVSHLSKAMNNQDVKLKRTILNALSNIAKHTVNTAETVVEANTYPNALIHLAHACPRVRKQAACLTRDMVKHSLALTQMVVNLGGIGALLEAAMQDDGCEVKLPCYIALGFMAGQSDQVAITEMSCDVVNAIAETLMTSTDDALLGVSAWALGQIGKHSPEHAKAVASTKVFPRLLQLYQSEKSSRDLQNKCKGTLKNCLQRCMVFDALEPLLEQCPPNLLKYVLGQFTKILPNDPKARRLFVMTGALRKVQEIEAEPGSTLMEYITIVNSCFPEEIVRYYSPGYPETLLEQVENYTPGLQVMDILREVNVDAGQTQTDNGIILDDTTSIVSSDMPTLQT